MAKRRRSEKAIAAARKRARETAKFIFLAQHLPERKWLEPNPKHMNYLMGGPAPWE